jgi:predicted nucleic acid-binding protein
MSIWYLDTSAALKLLLEEPESEALAHHIDSEQPDLAAGWLLETEMRRAANRVAGLTMDAVSTFLLGVTLYEMPGSVFREAGLLPGPTLRSLDSLHLSVAIRIGVDSLVTYDTRMTEAAHDLGLHVVAPA